MVESLRETPTERVKSRSIAASDPSGVLCVNRLGEIIPEPQLLEIDHVEVAAAPEAAWAAARRRDLADSTLIRALFTIRTLPARVRGLPVETATMTIDDIVSTNR